MKKHIAIAATAVFITSLFAGFAQAGPGHSRHRHHHHHNKNKNNVLEGVVIGAGALIIGTAIAQSLNRPRHPVRVQAVAVPPRPYPSANYYAATPGGHWEIRKMWVAPLYEARWNPAHYDASGKWVNGRHQQFLIADGYWKNERMWVERTVTY